MNALGYLRKSTEQQSHYSLEYQEKGIRNYCTANDLDLLEIFTDDGENFPKIIVCDNLYTISLSNQHV